MKRRKKGFTLIELIIVVVIIGILALIAIPKYYASVNKAKRSQIYANLESIKQALLGYYAINGAYPTSGSWPVVVTVDGDTIYNISNPSDSSWGYGYSMSETTCPGDMLLHADKLTGTYCWIVRCMKGFQSDGCTW
jgi:type IV pilus assembly protein PilA